MSVNGRPMLWTGPETGHIALDELTYESRWEESPTYVKFSERWTRNGVEVKSNAHVYIKRGNELQGEQARLG